MRLSGIARFYSFGILLTVAGWAWLATAMVAGEAAPGICIFRKATGIPCPSCGTTRSVLAILHGDFYAALSHNVVGFVALVALILLPLALILDVLWRRGYMYNYVQRFEDAVKKRPVILVFILSLIAINWIWKLVHL